MGVLARFQAIRVRILPAARPVTSNKKCLGLDSTSRLQEVAKGQFYNVELETFRVKS